MQLIGGAVLVALGILIVRLCIRDYRNYPETLIEDLWGYFHGRALLITAGAFIALIGAGIIFAFSTGSSLLFSSNFPFVTITGTSTPQP